MDGGHGLIGPVGDQCLALGLFSIKTGNFRTLKPHVCINNPRAAHVVQVGNGIDIIQMIQLPGQFQQTKQSAVFFLDVKVHHLEVGRPVMEHRGGPLLGQHDETGVGVGLAYRIQNRYRHSDIAQYRQSHDKDVTEKLFIFCHIALEN